LTPTHTLAPEKLWRVGLAALLLTLVAGPGLFRRAPDGAFGPAPQSARAGSIAERIRTRAEAPDLQFDLLSPDESWLRLGQRLYWTSDGGQNWDEITPTGLGTQRLGAAFFLDAQRGWLALTSADSAGSVAYALARTDDGGRTWRTNPLSLFKPGDPNAAAGALYLHFIDAQTGWLAIRRATSSNFSVGALFGTSDGGETWTPLTLPIGGPVAFVTDQLGWVAGGAAGDELYRTADGGRSWQRQKIAPDRPHQPPQYQLPAFENAQAGVLPVVVADENGPRVEFYRTNDGGQTWQLGSGIPLNGGIAPGTRLPLTVFDSQHWTMIAPSSSRVITSERGKINALVSESDFADGIAELDLAAPDTGWARYVSGQCARGPESGGVVDVDCALEVKLLRTADGGQTWTPLSLPPADENARAVSSESGPISPQGVQTFSGQGFDSCHPPGLSLMQNWIANSPYRVWALYIGGALRGCNAENQAAITQTFAYQLSQAGWKFLPAWVGPQAACSVFATRISYDTTTAYTQGVTEANAATEAAYALGLTLADKSGVVIYYDLEGYDTSNTACRDSAKAFINGWTAQLHARGNTAGVYGGGCSSALSDFVSLANVPDAIWPAHWIYSAYNSNATVWNVACVSNTLWVGSQRVRQYAGDHNETWGGQAWNIDSDVLDGPVAYYTGGLPPTPTPTHTATSTPTASPTPTATPTPTPGVCPPITAWKGEYWNNETLSGSAAVCRNDAEINFDWLSAAPHPGLSPDNFSARWTRAVAFSAGHYRFDLFHDDGARLYVDGLKVYEDWCANCSITTSIVVYLTAGTHNLRYEMYERLGWAGAGLSWTAVQRVFFPLIQR
jgi:photosystem II stability/assembly factor-like uncharacterized protein